MDIFDQFFCQYTLQNRAPHLGGKHFYKKNAKTFGKTRVKDVRHKERNLLRLFAAGSAIPMVFWKTHKRPEGDFEAQNKRLWQDFL